MLDNVPAWIFDVVLWGTGLGLAGLLLFRPAASLLARWRGGKSPATVTVLPGDNRAELNAALRLIADHAGNLKCQELKRIAEQAVTDLAPIVLRPPSYTPPDTTTTV